MPVVSDMKLRGYFQPAYDPQVRGLSKEGGEFWIGIIADDDITTDGLIKIELTVAAEQSGSGHDFASFHVHHDGLKVMRKLQEIGFLDIFEEIQASTFYDVVQCCARCNVPIQYNGYYGEELMSRQMYEILHPTGE
jgi:hypothetical protein